MDYDKTLQTIGEFGRYQRKVYVLLCFMYVFQCCQMLLLVFVSDKPTWQCGKHEQQLSSQQKNNNGYPCLKNGSPCQHIKFNNEFTSIATEWKLICDQEFKANFAQSVMMVGCLIGVFVSGPISDRFGRKLVIILSQVLGFSFGILTAFSQSYLQFLVARFLGGLSIMGAGISLFVLLSEIIGPTYRGPTMMVSSAFFSLGYGALAYFAYIFRDWRHLCIAASLPGLLYSLFSYYMFHESPRWLIAKGRIDEATMVLKKMAKANGNIFYETNIPTKPLNSGVDSTRHSKTSHGLWSLLAHRNIRLKMCILVLIWLVIAMVYYGLSFNTKNFKGSRYWNFFYSGIVEIPSCLLVTPLTNRIGRNKSLFFSMMLASTSCFLYIYTPQPSTFQTAAAMLGKFGISAAFAVIYLYTSELVQTIVRSTALGCCSMAARVGCVLAPIVVSLAVIDPKLPMLVFAMSGIIAALSVLFLPETYNKPVTETIENTT